jgi:hypothetical protein
MFPLRDPPTNELAVARAFVRKIVRDRAILVSRRGNRAVAIPMPQPYGTVPVGQRARWLNLTKPVNS